MQVIFSPGLKSDILLENSPPQRVATFRINAYLLKHKLLSIIMPFAIETAYKYYHNGLWNATLFLLFFKISLFFSEIPF